VLVDDRQLVCSIHHGICLSYHSVMVSPVVATV
jgi:hypothetical protein